MDYRDDTLFSQEINHTPSVKMRDTPILSMHAKLQPNCLVTTLPPVHPVLITNSPAVHG